MGLTTEERRRLYELASEFARDNPRLARALAGHRVRARRPARPRGRVVDWLAIVLTGAAMPLLIAGVALAQPVIIALGAATVINGPALFTIRHAGNVLHQPRE